MSRRGHCVRAAAFDRQHRRYLVAKGQLGAAFRRAFIVYYSAATADAAALAARPKPPDRSDGARYPIAFSAVCSTYGRSSSSAAFCAAAAASAGAILPERIAWTWSSIALRTATVLNVSNNGTE